MALSPGLFGTLVTAERFGEPAPAVARDLAPWGVSVPADRASVCREIDVDELAGEKVVLPAHADDDLPAHADDPGVGGGLGRGGGTAIDLETARFAALPERPAIVGGDRCR